MRKIHPEFRVLIVLCVTMALVIGAVPAFATFIVDQDPGGEKFYLIKADSTQYFSGHVGANNSGPIVDAVADVKVDTGNGYSNIKPTDKDDFLTDLLFTPADDTKYGDFSFRGQLESTGTVNIRVISYTDMVYDFAFYISNANQDFSRIGIVSDDGDWLKLVEIWTDYQDTSFKEVKQIEFSYQTETAPVPEPGTMLLLGTGLLGLAIFGKRRMSRES